MATAEQAADVRLDTHGIAPVPAADRDSTPLQQFWIWAGANIAPINWVLGALGIILGLSLVETILVIVDRQPRRLRDLRPVLRDGPPHRRQPDGALARARSAAAARICRPWRSC